MTRSSARSIDSQAEPTAAINPLRSSLDASVHPLIDAILKSLKHFTRRLTAAWACQHTEAQVLDRLHYKGNNQHRTALYWQRVKEIRRLCKRLQQIKLSEEVETLRLSFWNSPLVTSQSRLTKGAWTHVPDPRAIKFVLEILQTSTKLLHKMSECLSKAYLHLNLNVQTAAFLQFTLTLSAIISRLNILTTELLPAAEGCLTACYQLLQILDPAEAKRIGLLVGSKESERHSVPQQPSTFNPNDGSNVGVVAEILAEELGEPIERELVSVPPSEPISDTSVSLGGLGSLAFGEFSAAASSSVERTVINRTAETSKGREHKQTDLATRSRSKKKKIKRDEIDDIFGF